ncbi:MAG: DUF262 domain-containing protein [Bacteroidota bacterium]
MDVQPNNQNVNSLFGTETYYIDFYQRQYKWNENPVKRLLDDIFYKFNEEYKKHKNSDIELDKLIENYSWYYLNTYVTNKVDGKTFIVDGQQRLTTITLILIKLTHLSVKFNSALIDWIKSKVAGTSGYKKVFWMNHNGHIDTLQSLLENESDIEKIDVSKGITSINLVNNYKVISKVLDFELGDIKKFESFVFYFMHRLVLIKLNVEQTDVPMIFEVINDRGVRLKPYEILKGKLLGQINKEELEALNLNELWDNQVNSINNIYEDEIDNFFIYYLRAKYADTIGDSRKYDKDYHRVMFSSDFKKKLDLDHNPKNVKKFVQNEFKYYTNLHIKLLKYYSHYHKEYEHVYYNYLTDMDTQFILIHSSCILNDPEEDIKIKLVSKEVDRLFSLLSLQRSYDSNEFSRVIYTINNEIRNKTSEYIRPAFDKALLELLENAKGSKADKPLSYTFFKETGIDLGIRFKRYFFARVEKFIAENMNLEMKKSIYDLVRNTGHVHGFHIEHILARNNENLKIFNNDDEFFERERNRLGALLLLKGRDNQSSNDEVYKNKLKSYANSLYWNETLRDDAYKSKIDFRDMMKKYNLSFRPLSVFGPDEVEERHKLLYQITNLIWS